MPMLPMMSIFMGNESVESAESVESVEFVGLIKKTYRRKFRNQTSDNMQRWKSRGGKSQGGEVRK